MLKSRVCELLNIEYPIFQGGMAWVADAELAAAVSNAGGLGIIAGMNLNKEDLRKEIHKARYLTNKPFGVNVMLMSPYVEEVAELIIEERIPVVTTGAGNPTKYMKLWLASGIKVIPVVASVTLARMLEKKGATAIIAEGGESGGHIGELNTMPLIPQIVDAVNIPVIAAGGIADGRGMAAAYMLGAEGIQMGTRFLVAKECNIHQNFKNKVLNAGDRSTVVTGRRLGHPIRALKNEFTNKFSESENNLEISDEDISKLGTGALRKAVIEGDEQNGSFLCGEVAGLVNKEQTCKEIIEEVYNQAIEVIMKFNRGDVK